MDYEQNPSNLDSGSVIVVHQNSTLLDDTKEELSDVAYNITRKSSSINEINEYGDDDWAIPENEKKSSTIANLIDGLKMVQKEFMTILEKHGVVKIEAINNRFDHNYHQAMLEVEKDNCEEGIVVQEIQSGFTIV